jgi:hypothetical protein
MGPIWVKQHNNFQTHIIVSNKQKKLFNPTYVAIVLFQKHNWPTKKQNKK